MKLEEIQELWNRDREIDISELATESIRIPQIHDKYLKIYVDEKIKLRISLFKRVIANSFQYLQDVISKNIWSQTATSLNYSHSCY